MSVRKGLKIYEHGEYSIGALLFVLLLSAILRLSVIAIIMLPPIVAQADRSWKMLLLVTWCAVPIGFSNTKSTYSLMFNFLSVLPTILHTLSVVADRYVAISLVLHLLVLITATYVAPYPAFLCNLIAETFFPSGVGGPE